MAHDENNICNIGDQVLLQESRPLSKKKRWTIIKIFELRKDFFSLNDKKINKILDFDKKLVIVALSFIVLAIIFFVLAIIFHQPNV